MAKSLDRPLERFGALAFEVNTYKTNIQKITGKIKELSYYKTDKSLTLNLLYI